jgi:hypothetical protein
MPTYLPSGQVTAMHPYVMHQQGVPHSVPSHGPPSHVGHFHSIPAMGSLQQWQNQQVLRNETSFLFLLNVSVLLMLSEICSSIFFGFSLYQRVHRYLHRMKSNHPKLTKIQLDQMRTTTMKFLLMDRLFVKTIWMFILAKGQSLILVSRHQLGKHRFCE